jgi:uncharacterized tellurite resistance protein B-like protein
MQTRISPADTRGTAPAAVVPEGAPSLATRVSWGAVIAGAVVALAVGLMLNALGAGIGATTVDATARATPDAGSLGIGAAIWLAVSNLIGLAIGSYTAARLSGTADNTDGTLHGLAVWATSFILSAVLLGNLASGLASSATTGAANLLGGAAQGAGSAAAGLGQQLADRSGTGSLQGLLDRVQGTLNGPGGSPEAMTSDQRKAEMTRLTGRRIADGQLPAPDRERLNRLVAAEYGITPQEAQARVQRAEEQATQAAQQAEQAARRAADATARGASIASFSIFGLMLLGAIAAIIGARRGTRDLRAFRSARAV